MCLIQLKKLICYSTSFMNKKDYFITGIGTDVGKTFVSGLLCLANEWDYWKPIQAGLEGGTDSERVGLILQRNPKLTVHPERYKLKSPMSPHAAAVIDHVEIKLPDFILPDSERTVLVEGAGGLMVPLNNQDLILDLILHLGLPVIVVADFYLGSINHTLLTLEVLTKNSCDICALVFNGSPNLSSVQAVTDRFADLKIMYVPEIENIEQEFSEEKLGKILDDLVIN